MRELLSDIIGLFIFDGNIKNSRLLSSRLPYVLLMTHKALFYIM